MNKNIKIFALLICMLMTTSVIWADDNASDFYFPEGMTWTISILSDYGCDHKSVLVLQGDTLINSKTYHNVRMYNAKEQQVLSIPITADGKKIYAHIYDRDILLYDFGLEVGDSIMRYRSINMEDGIPEDLRFDPDSTYSYVTGIDSVTLLDGRRAKRLHYNIYLPDIEYVGCSYGGLFSIIDVPLLTTCGSNACCCTLNDELIYEDYVGVCALMDIHGTSPNAYLPSLCDTWNVMVVDNVMCGGCEEYKTYVHALGKDTIIGERRYRQLLADGEYEGALREGDNRDIYCVPAGTTHEYLLYAFNAKAGDVLTNVWLGGSVADSPDSWQMEVVEIQETAPRRFVLSTGYVTPEPGLELAPLYCYWTEGIGLGDGPIGSKRCVGCDDNRGYTILCAYKDGKQVYDNPAWDWCYYDSAKQPADTVALYWRSGDGPGSTTVTPVDPNQVVATLNDNLLSIREQSGEEVTYSLAVTPISHAPARHALPAAQKDVAADTFRNSVAVQLSEDGSYTLTLSKAGWENDIYGTFDYIASGLQPIAATDAPARKLLRNGQLLIQQGDRIYTPTGMQVE